jgi:hypothetical protein
MRQLSELTAGEGMVIWHTYSLCFEGEVLFRSGQSERGLDLLRTGVGQLRRAGFVQHRTTFLRALAIGLIDSGQYGEAAVVIEEALAEAIASNQGWFRSELLRTKGDVVIGLGSSDADDDAEALYGQALAIAREQGVLSLELRPAISLARLRRLQGRGDEGNALLRGVYDRFAEGFDTADLMTARGMIDVAA